ncbi:Prostaglandin G/H synthase 1 [Branchiostoma belcheri]|nr:Prostaglandin G/H synthase 1 [Branchiostoma belcheri]
MPIRAPPGDVFTVRMGMEPVVILNGYTAVTNALVDTFLHAERNVTNKSFLPFEGVAGQAGAFPVLLDPAAVVHLQAARGRSFSKHIIGSSLIPHPCDPGFYG